jgi:hypothetical protein
LIDIVTHETNHLDQIGTQRDPFSANPSTKEERGDAKKSFKYFLLDDEIESMVEGMYARAQHKDIPLDYVFDDYLLPFIKSKYITPAEYEEVRSTWVKYALERYPDAVFSNKVDKIINSI